MAGDLTVSEFNEMADNATLSMQDFFSVCQRGEVSEYLSLSFARNGDSTKVSITTTGHSPVTYSAIIPAATTIDFQSLQLVAHREGLSL